jgi:hypothetical protein
MQVIATHAVGNTVKAPPRKVERKGFGRMRRPEGSALAVRP